MKEEKKKGIEQSSKKNERKETESSTITEKNLWR